MKVLALLAALALATPAHALDAERLTAAAKAEEAALAARVGVAVIDTKDGAAFAYRGDERFAMMSTHKAFSCAALLAKVDRGDASLSRRVVILATDLVPYSPVTENHIAPDSMSLGEICAAALGVSDNTAANFILDAIGGPAGLTGFFRSLGDEASRLDRNETDLNENLPGDPRDTTTPNAAAADLRKLLIGDVLRPASRERLKTWMIEDRVAGPLLRAALPERWTIADKTGAGERGGRGIVAVIWPPDRAPLVAAIYVSDTEAKMPERNAAIARIGKALTEAIQ